MKRGSRRVRKRGMEREHSVFTSPYLFTFLSPFTSVYIGAGRVTFSSRVSFMSAVSCRFLQVTYGDIDKKVNHSF